MRVRVLIRDRLSSPQRRLEACDLRFVNGASIQSIWEILVATSYTLP